MRLLFCYDGPLYVDEEKKYYGIALNNDLFQRYECISNDISISIRVRAINNKLHNKLSEIDRKYKINEIPNLSSVKGIFINRRKARKKLISEIQNSDLVIIRLPSAIGNMSAKICRMYNKPYIVEMVGCPWDALWNLSIKGKIVAPFSFLRTKNELKKSKYTIYVTNCFLQKRYPSDGKQISCSNVVLNNIDDSAMKKRLSKIEKFDNKKIILGTLGGLDVKFKGQKYVIKIINELLKSGYDVEYQVVGSGLPNYLNKLIKKYNVTNNVKIIGPIKHEKVFEWLDNLDIYIQPSTQEGLCRSIIEAMSRGCPIIASNAGGNSELISNEFIFKKKNTKQLLNLIKKMDKEKMKIESINNFNESKKYYIESLRKKRTKFMNDYKNDVLSNNKNGN